MAVRFPPVLICSSVLLTCLALTLPGSAEDDPQAAALAAVQGSWTREQQTPAGPVRLVKEHVGRKTTVQVFDPAGNLLAGHESEFKLDVSGKIRLFTYSNLKATAGPDKGRVAKNPVTFAYRTTADQFIEVYGLLPEDPSPPRMVVWERLKPQPPKIEAASL